MNHKLETKAQREYPVMSHYVGGKDAINSMITAAARNELDKDAQLSTNRAQEIAAGIVWGAYAREWLSLEERTQMQWKTLTNDYFKLYDQIIIAEDTQTVQAMLVELTGTRTLVSDMI